MKVHVDPRIALDESLEVFQARHKLLLVSVCIFDLLSQPCPMNAMVGWKPCSGSDDLVLMRDIMLVSVLVDHVGQ